MTLRISEFHDGQLPIYAHLLPLVDYLVAHGMAPDPEGFHGTQGGWEYHAASHIPFDALDAGIHLPSCISLNRNNDNIFDRSSWSSIMGINFKSPVVAGYSSGE